MLWGCQCSRSGSLHMYKDICNKGLWLGILSTRNQHFDQDALFVAWCMPWSTMKCFFAHHSLKLHTMQPYTQLQTAWSAITTSWEVSNRFTHQCFHVQVIFSKCCFCFVNIFKNTHTCMDGLSDFHSDLVSFKLSIPLRPVSTKCVFCATASNFYANFPRFRQPF